MRALKTSILILVLSLLVYQVGCSSGSGSAPETTTTITATTEASSTTTTQGASTTSTASPSETSTTSTETTTTTTTSTTTTSLLPLIKGPALGFGGNDADQIFRSLTVSPSNPNIIYVGTEGNGIFKSSDGGVTWNWLRQGLLYTHNAVATLESYPEIWEMVINPSNENHLHIATVGGGPGPVTGNYRSATGGVYYTLSGGEPFTREVNGLSNAAVNSLAMDTDNSATLYLGLNGDLPTFGLEQFAEAGVFKSLDAGANWAQIYTTPVNRVQSFWKIVPFTATTLITCGLNLQNSLEAIGLLKSTDGGQNWASLTGPAGVNITFFDVAPQDQNFICALERDKGKIYKSTDGGNNWEMFNNSASGPIKISPHNKQNILFSNFYTLFKSSDGLQNSLAVLTPEGVVDDIEFTSDPNIIYVGCRGYRIYKSTNGGESFTLMVNLRQYIDSQ